MGFFCCCQETSPVKAMSGVSKKNLLKNFITVDLSMKNPPVRANRRIWCILRAMERILEKQIGYLSNVKQCNTLQCSTCWSLFRHTSRYDKFPAHWTFYNQADLHYKDVDHRRSSQGRWYRNAQQRCNVVSVSPPRKIRTYRMWAFLSKLVTLKLRATRVFFCAIRSFT